MGGFEKRLNFFPRGWIFVCFSFVCCYIFFHLRAKWFELMNTEEEVEKEEDEEVMKRKREEEEDANVKVKKIKLKVAKW